MVELKKTSQDALGVLLRIVQVAVIGVVVGGLVSIASLLFVATYRWLNVVLFVSSESAKPSCSILSVALTILIPTLGGLIVGWICSRLIKSQHAPGAADVIAVAQSGRSEMDLKNGFLSSAASLLSLGSGASVGQYGPLVHMGAVLGSALRKTGLTMRAGGNVTIGCGVAAAISTVFNAPIAGIVFAHEVVLRHFSLRAFAPITVASTMGFIIANVLLENPPFAALGAFKVEHVIEFLFFALTGVLGGLVAVVLMRLILRAATVAKHVNIAQALKPAAAGFALGIIAIFVPEILGTDAETINGILGGASPATHYLALLVIAKIAATALCLGFGFVGGVFSPALMIGVTFGALIGVGVDTLIPNYYAGAEVYAICGMVAVTSPVIGAPLTTILIVFELTRNYDAATAAMIAAVFSNLVSYRIFGRSLFDKQLFLRGIDLSRGREHLQLTEETVAPYVSQKYFKANANDLLEDVIKNMQNSAQQQVFVSDAHGGYIGSQTLTHLISASEETQTETSARTLADVEFNVHYVTRNVSILTAMQTIKERQRDAIAVVNSDEDKTLAGVVFSSSVISAYLEISQKLHEEEQQ